MPSTVTAQERRARFAELHRRDTTFVLPNPWDVGSVNVLVWPDGPSVAEIAAAGAKRVSTGGLLARAAYGALMAAVHELQVSGTTTFRESGLTVLDQAAFA